jgi:hypothetical protein
MRVGEFMEGSQVRLGDGILYAFASSCHRRLVQPETSGIKRTSCKEDSLRGLLRVHCGVIGGLHALGFDQDALQPGPSIMLNLRFSGFLHFREKQTHMQFTHTQLAAVGFAFLALLVVGTLLFLAKRSGAQEGKKRLSRGPVAARYTCARCSKEAMHSNRTINAWENGTRRFFCNECHKAWRQSRPATPSGDGVPRSTRASVRGPATVTSRSIQGAGRSGCLGILAALALLPLTLVYVASRYV